MKDIDVINALIQSQLKLREVLFNHITTSGITKTEWVTVFNDTLRATLEAIQLKQVLPEESKTLAENGFNVEIKKP